VLHRLQVEGLGGGLKEGHPRVGGDGLGPNHEANRAKKNRTVLYVGGAMERPALNLGAVRCSHQKTRSMTCSMHEQTNGFRSAHARDRLKPSEGIRDEQMGHSRRLRGHNPP